MGSTERVTRGWEAKTTLATRAVTAIACVWGLGLGTTGCLQPGAGTTSGGVGGATDTSSTEDAAPADGGTADAASSDAVTLSDMVSTGDAGPGGDAGPVTDGGWPDAGPTPDGGWPDAGPAADGGVAADIGLVPDAGPLSDAGAPADGGSPDAANPACPTAVIQVAEGKDVIPQTTLYLLGSQSFGSGAAISKYQWTVQQPPGSQSFFLPSSTAPAPSFETNVAGTYIFFLDVWDDAGVKSCVPAKYEVEVVPDEVIHVELLWDTPADPDQTDEGPEAGADLDLHFIQPCTPPPNTPDRDGDGEPDPYFIEGCDCFWFSPSPGWGSSGGTIDHEPSLDRDDTDGAGPENVNLLYPEDGATYAVAVHYFDDHGFGDSYATVRVYIHSVLAFQAEGVQLTQHDLWEVATIAWPSGAVSPITAADGGDLIVPDYEPAGFFD